MNINYIRVIHFLTTVKYMNMNKAAKELFITQPALSLSISRMENDIGITLFYRDKNRLILSKEAKELLPYFQQIRRDYQSLEKEIERLKAPKDNIVHVSFSGSSYFFSSLYMSGNINSYDKANVQLSYVNAQQACEGVLSGYIDLAIAAPPIIHRKLTTIDIYSEPIGLIVSREHPFAQYDTIPLKKLENIRINGLFKANSFQQICDAVFRDNNINVEYASENNYSEYQNLMEGNDKSCGFLSTPINYETNFNNKKYKYITIEDTPINRKMSISYLTNGDAQYKYAHLIDYLRDYLPYLNTHFNSLGKSMYAYFNQL